MQGVSRASLTSLLQAIQAMPPAASGHQAWDPRVGEMFAVVRLLSREPSVRHSLTDSGRPESARKNMAQQVFARHVGPEATALVVTAAGLSWANSRDLMDALEVAAVTRAFQNSEQDQSLDSVEDELFRFARLVQATPQLRGVLDDAQASPERRVALLESLLRGKVQPTTLHLLEHLVRDDRSRRFTAGIAQLERIAAQRRKELTAQVTVSQPLSLAQQQRMQALVGQLYQAQQVRLHVVVDPHLMGGARIQVGHEVIDGSGKQRLQQVQRQIMNVHHHAAVPRPAGKQ